MKITKAKKLVPPAPKARAVAPAAYSWDFYRDGVTQSFISGWLTCREKARLDMVNGLRQVRGADAFSYGTLTHEALEVLYAPGRQPTGPEMDAAMKTALANVLKENPRATADTLNKVTEQAKVVRVVVEAYFKFWHKDFKEIAWVAREKEFKHAYKLPSGRMTFVRGKRDGDFRAGKTAPRLFLFETKTKSRLDEDNLMDWLPLDLQTNLYFWAMKQDYGETPAGVKYNVLRKPGLRQGVSETFDAFLKRIVKDVAKEPEKYFHRYDVAVLAEEIGAWEIGFAEVMRDIEAWWNGIALTFKVPTSLPVVAPSGGHYMNPTACIGKYGACEFLKLCGRGEKTGLFQRETPFNELKK